MNDPPVVLLVDDEPRILSALRRTLRREGLALEEASNGSIALDRIGESPSVDLVISDQKMPGLSGVELLARIRKASPSTRRILLSSWTSEIPPGELSRAAPAFVLAKPWDDTGLKASIRSALYDEDRTV